MPGTLRSILDTFPSHKVLVIGDLMLDEYLTGDCSRLSPEAPVPVLAVSASRVVLGGAANTANNIAALGGRVVLLGAVGDDEAGHRLGEHAKQAGIEFAPVRDRRPTVRKIRVVGQQQQLLRLDYEAEGTIDSEAEHSLLATAEREIPTCDIVVISDYAKGCLTERLCQSVIARAHELGKRVVIDPTSYTWPQENRASPECRGSRAEGLFWL